MALLTVRAFRRDTDTAPLLRLLQETEALDNTGEAWSHEKLALYLDAPGHDPERERWVIAHPTQPETLLGHAALYLPHSDDERRVADGMVLVHPAWRHQGLGHRLLGRLEQHVSPSPAVKTLRFYLRPKNKEAEAFARQHGLTAHPADSYRHMMANLSEVTQEATLPEGFTFTVRSKVCQRSSKR